MNKHFTLNDKLDSHILVHIPHSSLHIPKNMNDDYLLSQEELVKEKKVLADMYTDDLFSRAFEEFGGLRLDVSRVFLDVERFRDDTIEPMAQKGMGLAYTKTSMLKDLRTLKYKDEILKIYDEYHQTLDELIEKKLEKHGKCLIVDCHSFPSKPRPYQLEKDYDHIDVCIGFDQFHKDSMVVEICTKEFQNSGYIVKHNTPYAGSMVSNKHFSKEKSVKSIMIELNRRLYMDDLKEFTKNDNYQNIKDVIEIVFNKLTKEGYIL